MTSKPSMEEFVDSMLELQQGIGELCVKWPDLEIKIELLIWQLLGLDDDDGKLITTRLDIRPRLEMLAALADRKIDNIETKDKLAEAVEIITRAQPERNLIVHGQWQVDVSQREIWSHVQRGKYKDKPQKLSRELLKRTLTAVTVSYVLLVQVGMALSDQENA